MLAVELDYVLPEEAIAQHPTTKRDGARMLVLSEPLEDARVRDFAEVVPANALLVLNDTRVIRARIHAEREGTGGKVEILFLAPSLEPGRGSHVWEALVRANRSLAIGSRLRVGHVVLVLGTRSEEGATWVEASVPVLDLIAEFGHVPLPPYVRRGDEPADEERYQTVFADHAGSAAAPTAGLHLTSEMLTRLQARGVELGFVTLHVGAGTFRPVSTPDLADHRMHSESYMISTKLQAQVLRAQQLGMPIIAVGTTVVRALESAAAVAEREGQTALPVGCHATRLLITPGYTFRVVEGLLTNFHAPLSTLLALVYAFAGKQRVRSAYSHAIEQGYRFLSYGDAMWIPHRTN
jgi:S-adenosylmethionine:tRNA ribosyltransferase-isomerase